jgi:hypothetical protein
MKGKNKMKKAKEITPENKLKKKIKDLKKEAKPYLAYKKLILVAAKSKYAPEDVIDALKFVSMHIKKKNWEMVDRVGGTSGDLMARGACPKCTINLVGKGLRPREFTLPCLIEGCPFTKQTINPKETS